jgi:hypothetical protein
MKMSEAIAIFIGHNLCVGLLVVVLSPPALAGDIPLPLGEEQALMGNAGTALLSSSGAVYFNPASLMGIKSSRLSATGSLLYFAKDEITTSVGTAESEDRGFSTGAALTLWSGKSSSYGLGIISPFTTRIDTAYSDAVPGSATPVTVNASTNSTLTGLVGVWATTWSEGFHVGAQLGVLESSTNAKASYVFQDSLTTRSVAGNLSSKSTAYALQPRFGFIKEFDNGWDAGVSIELPVIGLTGKKEIRSEYLIYTGGTPTITRNTDSYGETAQSPLQIVGGVRIPWAKDLDIFADLSWNSALTFRSADTNYRYGSRISPRLGARFKMKDINLYGGVHHSPVWNDADLGQPTYNRWGLSGGTFYQDGRFKGGLGFFLMKTESSGVASNYEKVTITGLILSSSYDY